MYSIFMDGDNCKIFDDNDKLVESIEHWDMNLEDFSLLGIAEAFALSVAVSKALQNADEVIVRV